MRPYFNDRLEVDFILAGQKGNLIIIPVQLEDSEQYRFKGEYLVYYHHPFYKSTYFIIDQDQNQHWSCCIHPPYVSHEFIGWIGTEIEKTDTSLQVVRY